MFCSPQGYSAQSGTSMASPHLGGTVALLLSAGIADTGPSGLFDDVKARLCATADPGFGVNSTRIPTNDPRYPNYFGCGVIDADGAVLGLTPPANRPPVAVDDAATTPEDTGVSIPVMANDTDPDGDGLSVSNVGSPAHGTATLNAAGQAIDYRPSAGYSGPDSFTYTISDGAGGTDTGLVSVTVTPVDDPPTAAARSASTTAPAPVTITLTGTDPDTCELTFQVVDLPDHGGIGSLVNQACTAGWPNSDSATVVYTATAGYSGPDSFTYRVADATGPSAAATVSITVAPAASPTVHVGDLDGTTATNGKTWTAKVSIKVDDSAHGAVAGAVVTGTWSNGAAGSATCTTTSTGRCTVQKTKLSRSSVSSVDFTVTSVTLSGATYVPASNHDPDPGPDSTGTSITVRRPA